MTRRAAMTLFASPDDPQSHRTRIVVAEKNVELDVINAAPGRYPDDLLDLNPYRTLPTLLDRDLVLYDARVIMDYIDERFPHPPLMPVDPLMRAQFRLAMYRIERDWYEPMAQIEKEQDRKLAGKLKDDLRESILQSAEIFKVKPFFLSDEFSLVDATIAPILWRLRRHEIELPASAAALTRYAAMLFARPAFRASLSDVEMAMGTR